MINKERDIKKAFIESSKKIFKKILIDKRLRNLWIFGLILTGFSIFIDFKLLFVVLLLMVFLTAGATKNIEIEETNELDDLNYSKEEMENILKVTEEHINSGGATLEEKLEYNQLKKELNEVNKLITEKNVEK